MRDDVFLVSNVLPAHATREATIAACEASLRRLGTDYLDLYLLHWRGMVPLWQTVGAFEELRAAGLIRHWGVSNFDIADIVELLRVEGGRAVQTDQVLYNLSRHGIEWNLLPWCRQNGLPIMAYSPLGQGRLLAHPVLRGIAVQYRPPKLLSHGSSNTAAYAPFPRPERPSTYARIGRRWTCTCERST